MILCVLHRNARQFLRMRKRRKNELQSSGEHRRYGFANGVGEPMSFSLDDIKKGDEATRHRFYKKKGKFAKSNKEFYETKEQ